MKNKTIFREHSIQSFMLGTAAGPFNHLNFKSNLIIFKLNSFVILTFFCLCKVYIKGYVEEHESKFGGRTDHRKLFGRQDKK